MARPKTFKARSKVLSDGRTSWYARFTDQHGVRQEPPIGYDLTDAEIQSKLDDIKYEVMHGTWTPPGAKVAAPDANATFLVFASDWRHTLAQGTLRPRTLEHADWALGHLLTYFARKRMRSIDKHEVDAYRDNQTRRGQLSPGSINKTIEVLARILDAGEDYYPAGNPAAGKQRKVKLGRRETTGSWLDYDQLVALLDAGHLLDTVPHAELVERYGARVPENRFLNLGRRPQLAAMYLTGMRVSESCALKCKHVNLSRATLHVAQSKQGPARDTRMHRMAYDIMSEWRSRHPNWRPEAPLFPHARGGHRTKDNTRVNVLQPAAQLAALLLEERGQNPLPEVSKTHDGRRTTVNWWAEAGKDQLDSMAWCGHKTARLVIEVYRQRRGADPRVKEAMADVPETERALSRDARAAK